MSLCPDVHTHVPRQLPRLLNIYSLPPSSPKCTEKARIGEFPSLEYMNPNSVEFRFNNNMEAALGGCWGGGSAA